MDQNLEHVRLPNPGLLYEHIFSPSFGNGIIVNKNDSFTSASSPQLCILLSSISQFYLF